MNAVAEKIEPEQSSLRRFQIPDLDKFGTWLVPRVRKAYPHLNDRQLIGWIKAIIYSSEFQFLFQTNSVGLFQIHSAHTLSPQPVVYECFVFADDPENKESVAQAALFYAEAAKWARHQGAEAIIVERRSDVPHELIREQLGRLLKREEVFCKL